MKPRHQVSRAAIELIKRFEGYRPVAARLPDGRWTVGYGHTHTARAGAEVSEQDAEALLLYDLISISRGVDEAVYATLTQNQFDALCAFAFNVGLDSFRRSAALRRVNEGAPIEAAFAMELWRKAEFDGEAIVVDALVRRRAAEKLLFLTPPEGWTPAPSALLRPVLDQDRDFAPAGPVHAVPPGLPETPAAAPPPESPVQAAAEQVSARLQTLFAQTRPAAPRTPEPTAAPPEVAPEHEPPPEPAAESPPPEPAPLAATPPEVDEYTPARDLFEPEAVAEDAPAPFAYARPRRARRIGFASILALALPGAAFFGAGAFWAVGGRGVAVGGPLTPTMVAALACVTGVLMAGIASYLLMQRLGQDAEQSGSRA